MKVLFLLIFYSENVASYADYDESTLINCYACIEYITDHKFRRDEKNDRDCRKLKESSYGLQSKMQYSRVFAKEKYRIVQNSCLFAESVGTVTETDFSTKR